MGEELELIKWTPEKQDLIFQAFGIVIEEKVCNYCGDPLERESMCMFPDLKEDESYILTCNCPMCVTQYMDYYKENKNE